MGNHCSRGERGESAGTTALSITVRFVRGQIEYFFILSARVRVCVRAKKKNKGMIFFFHLCSSVWAIISLHWPRRSNWACWRETERLGMRAGQAAICFRVRKKETKGKLPDG